MEKRSENHKLCLPTATATSADPIHGTTIARKMIPSSGRSKTLAVLLGLLLLVYYLWRGHSECGDQAQEQLFGDEESMCPQASPISPENHYILLKSLDDEYASQEFKLKAYESLSGAIKIPTETFDDLKSPDDDPRWEVHYDFHNYLEMRFPRIHASLRRTKVNTYGLVYHWQGSNASLKPLLLAAHSDVVPVDPATIDEWINPPYSGLFDGEWIWGRGSCDDKPGLIGSMITIETLLERGYEPVRTVILAFGIDEERGGITGASAIGQYLLETYGENSIAMIVDEGGGYSELDGTIFASPAVAEKGYLDVRVDVTTPGGHSSRPPKHTGIGILASVITELEAHPHEPLLLRNGTYYQALQCRAEYDGSLSSSMKTLIRKSRDDDEALEQLTIELSALDPLFYAQAGTTQAIDLIGGGIKINALPEAVWTVVNHRIADYSSPAALRERFASIVAPVASKYNMSIDAFGKLWQHDGAAYGQIRLSDAYNTGLEPAPVTPTAESGPYALLSGTILSTLGTNLRTGDFHDPAIISPGLSLGNTDTRYYWSLTKHIFRYGHRAATDSYNGAHTSNEALRAEGFIEIIRFFTRLILNADETNLLGDF